MRDGLWQLLDGRAFASAWYWLLLAVAWSLALRGLLGVPTEVAVRAARVDPEAPGEDPRALALLDWLSLTLPRWQAGRAETAALTAAGTFLVAALAGLGFGLGLAGAQGLVLLVAPLMLLAALRMQLAARLLPVLAAAQAGTLRPNAAAARAGRSLARHRWLALALAVVSVALTSAWGSLWMLRHPWG